METAANRSGALLKFWDYRFYFVENSHGNAAGDVCNSVDGKPLLTESYRRWHDFFFCLFFFCFVAEPIPECDVEQWNKHFMLQSEELYDALMDCHWEPLDSIESPVPPCSW